MIAGGLIVTGLLVAAAWAVADPIVHSKTFVRQTSALTNPPIIGDTIIGSAAKLTRSENAVSIKITTTQLPAGAYTAWAVIFNNPSACTHGANEFKCGSADVTNLDTLASILWYDGGLVDETGVGHFGGTIEEGNPPGVVNRAGCNCGLMDAENAEIHSIIRYHGPLSEDPDMAILQLTTAGGGCGVGLFPCYDPQAVRFPLSQ